LGKYLTTVSFLNLIRLLVFQNIRTEKPNDSFSGTMAFLIEIALKDKNWHEKTSEKEHGRFFN
jgi:hypothetical protein